jgi:hypothetical protein
MEGARQNVGPLHQKWGKCLSSHGPSRDSVAASCQALRIKLDNLSKIVVDIVPGYKALSTKFKQHPTPSRLRQH